MVWGMPLNDEMSTGMDGQKQGEGPEAASQRLEEVFAGRRIFVDFDHTLFLWNSTEAFIDTCRPSFIMAPMLKLLGALAPWKLAGARGYFVWRDVVRLFFVLVLTPWTAWSFTRRAPAIFAAHLNRRLDNALSAAGPGEIIIVTFGVDFVVRALLRQSRYESVRVIAPSIWSMAGARRRGKTHMLRRKGFILTTDDVVITDSAVDDADMLAAAGYPLVRQWPDEINKSALARAYVPLYYTAKVKRTPGFLVKQVFLEEMLVVLLMFAPVAGLFGLQALAALAGLFIAYMLVYEIGYAENDRIGATRETAPRLSDAYDTHKDYPLEPSAWIWAAAITAAAMALMPEATRADALARLGLAGFEPGLLMSIALLAAVWMAALIVARAAFWLFNHVQLAWRVFAYVPLHVTKYFSPVLLLPLHPAGAALGLAQIVRTWSMYAIRRAGGDEHRLSSQMVRLTFFALAGAMMAMMGALSPHEWGLFALIAVFCIVRALPEMRRKMTGRAARLEG